ncbi:MAG TPA: RcnB family protein [Ramlibacter sp.]|uniref:RcnB family protein n=1 Tax=Ramlibacter sp. TaxID=1917967 RepID=UPI002BF87771|nr:RcnB family protein [Ramlibacter sp.]HVZ46687.1 RcnB family protein [Ramlibacter sp.]
MRMMKSIATVCAVATAAMSFSGAALAQDHERHHHGDAGRAEHQWDHRGHGGGGPVVTAPSNQHHRDWNGHAQYQHGWSGHREYAPHYVYRDTPHYVYRNAPRYAYGPSWRVGGYYSGPRYIVNNWGAYPGLYAPPYGYQWVRTDTGDFLLVAIATGLIANLLAHSNF